MSESSNNFEFFLRKMKTEKLPDIVIEHFKCYYDRLVKGETGVLSERDIDTVGTLPDNAIQSREELVRIGKQHLWPRRSS